MEQCRRRHLVLRLIHVDGRFCCCFVWWMATLYQGSDAHWTLFINRSSLAVQDAAASHIHLQYYSTDARLKKFLVVVRRLPEEPTAAACKNKYLDLDWREEKVLQLSVALWPAVCQISDGNSSHILIELIG